MNRRERGYSLVELLVALALLALAATLGTPSLLRLGSGVALRSAAAEVMGSLREARQFAIRHQARVAVKFRCEADGAVSFALYRDGDGDGVRNDDIEAGTDPLAQAPRRLAHLGRAIRFGFPPGPPPRDPSDRWHRLDRLDDPVRFNRSDLASFSPLDGATPGSVYLTDGSARLVAVRVDSRSGRPHVITWDALADAWR